MPKSLSSIFAGMVAGAFAGILLSIFFRLLSYGLGDYASINSEIETRRREPHSEKQDRGGVIYVCNEQTPYTGAIYDNNGKYHLEEIYKDGKKTEESKWELNEQHGWVWAYKDGNITSYKEYEGDGKAPYAFKQLRTEIIHMDRKLIGKKEWYANGRLKSETSYGDGEKIILEKHWEETGKPTGR
ncbi:MAG: hypothetical protein HQM09_08670 [Candidatus Riflebacteria bacterium]|nr:hypothetical protein [Candidatus Riflebacteria bacterium]